MADFYSHPSAEVSPKAKIGKGTKIWNLAQVREGAVIGKNVIISKNVYIDAHVKIGNGSKVQNNVSIYHPATIEADVFVGPSVTFTNDRFPRAFIWNEERLSGPTIVRKGASLGANSTIVCGITIGKYAMIAAGAVVTKDVPDHAIMMGVPARVKGFACICGKPLKLQKEAKNAEYYCDSCKKKFMIPKKDYLKIQ